MWKWFSRVRRPRKPLPRANPNDAQVWIAALCRHYGPELTAQLLGITEFGLHFKRQSLPVSRLAYALHRATFSPTRPLRVIELLTFGKYEPTPQPVVDLGRIIPGKS